MPADTNAIGSYCSSISWGGLEMNVLRFLGWMHKRGWSAYLYARPDSRLAQQAAGYDVPVREVGGGSRLADVVHAPRLARMLRRDGVNLLTLHQSRDMLIGILGKRSSNGPLKLIYSQHMHIGSDKRDAVHTWQYRQLDAWVTPLQWLADRVLEKTRIPPGRVHVIPRGIELKRFTKELPEQPVARDSLQLPQDSFVIGTVGRLDPKKCQDVVIKAISRVHQAGHPIHALFVGDRTHGEAQAYAEYLRQLSGDLSLTDFVHFRSHRDDVETAYAAMSVFVLPSLAETYGMVTIEAMASGLPIIATGAGGTQDLIRHEQNGLLFTPNDDAELARTILTYLTDSGFAECLAMRARQDAVERFSHTRQCEQWERLLRVLAD